MASVKKEHDASKHAKRSKRSKSVSKPPRTGHDGEDHSAVHKPRRKKSSLAPKRSSEALPAARIQSTASGAPHETTDVSPMADVPSREPHKHDDGARAGSEVQGPHSSGAQHCSEQVVPGGSRAVPQSPSAVAGTSGPPEGTSIPSSPEHHRTTQVASPDGRTGQPPAVTDNVGHRTTSAIVVSEAAGESRTALEAAEDTLLPLVSGVDIISQPESVAVSIVHSKAATPLQLHPDDRRVSRVSIAADASAFASTQRSRVSFCNSVNTTRSAYRRTVQTQKMNEAIAERAAMDRRESIALPPPRTSWATVSRSCIAFIAIVWVCGAMLLLLAVYRGREGHAYKSCDTPACREFARSLRESINTSVPPCENFGRFVCDGWSASYRLTVREQAFIAALESVALSQLSLNASARQSRQGTKEKAALFYQSCDAVGRGDRNELENVLDALRREGIVWPHRSPETDVLHTALRSSLVLRWGAPFDVTLKADETSVVVELDAFDMFASLREKFVAMSGGSPERMSYFETLRSHFKAGEGDLLEFEKVNQLDTTAYTTLPNSVQASRHTVMLDERAIFSGTKYAAEDYWREMLRPFVPLNETTEIVLTTRTEDFIRKIWEFWVVRSAEDMHIFVSWCVVQIAALFANQQLQVNFYGSKEEARFRQGASCLASTFLIAGGDLFSDYNRFVFAGRARYRAHELIRTLYGTFLRRLHRWKHFDAAIASTMKWNTTEVKKRVVNAGSAPGDDTTGDMTDSLVHNWQNIPNQDTSKPALKSEIYTVIKAGEMIVLLENDFLIMPYALAFPYFDRSASAGINYAGAGGTVAFALAKLFIDAYGVSAAGNETLEAGLRCIKNASVNATARNYGKLVMQRALAASFSFEAYEKEWASWDMAVEDLEEYSGAQLFFMASCYVLCPGSASGNEEGSQCNAHLQNVEEFARVFSCSTSTKMNPPSKCSVL